MEEAATWVFTIANNKKFDMMIKAGILAGQVAKIPQAIFFIQLLCKQLTRVNFQIQSFIFYLFRICFLCWGKMSYFFRMLLFFFLYIVIYIYISRSNQKFSLETTSPSLPYTLCPFIH